jgi:hypothetical protein
MNEIKKEEVTEFFELLSIIFGSVFCLVKPIMQFMAAALKALMNPKNEHEWRTAYAFFFFPVVFIGGTAVLVAAVILWLVPHPFDWLLVCVWLFYILIGEPYMYYIEGHGFDRWIRWIEFGDE